MLLLPLLKDLLPHHIRLFREKPDGAIFVVPAGRHRLLALNLSVRK